MGTSSEINISLIKWPVLPCSIQDFTQIFIVLKHLMYRIDKFENLTLTQKKKIGVFMRFLNELPIFLLRKVLNFNKYQKGAYPIRFGQIKLKVVKIMQIEFLILVPPLIESKHYK